MENRLKELGEKMTASERVSQYPEQPQAKRQIRNLLLDRRFQLRWVLRVIIFTSIIVAVMGYFLYRTVEDATDQMLVQKLGDPVLTVEAQEAFMKQADEDKLVTLGTLIGGLISIVLLITVLTIIYTHKIAGPVHKMRQLFLSIDGTNLQLWAKLRKADELQEAFTDFDNMIRRLREHRRGDIEELGAIRALVESNKEHSEIQEHLDGIIARYRDSVKMD